MTPPQALSLPSSVSSQQEFGFVDALALPEPSDLKQVMGEAGAGVIIEAEEVVSGRVRLFGGPAVPLVLKPDPAELPLRHWTSYERRKQSSLAGKDIKIVWEPGRFGWVFPLARAYRINADERYPAAFWQYAQEFFESNPPNLGPQWSSGQEIALRLISLSFAAAAFRSSAQSFSDRMRWLAEVIALHARRIRPTLIYARSQKNNHLLTEAAGLMTAGCILPDHSQSEVWRRTGLSWFERGILAQVAPDGTYIQHSTNYHRLALHAALWVHSLLAARGERMSGPVLERLGAAASWLAERLDSTSGRVPNLGHNDGSNILPLACAEYADFRPVVQAASAAFNGAPILPPGPWDEPALWLGLPKGEGRPLAPVSPRGSSADILRADHTWGELRAVRFHERPAHADQLHTDLWWNGWNIAADAGTYLYNAPPPWENGLAVTRVHNTIEIDGADQMTRAGQFRWLDWAQADIDPREAVPAGPGLKAGALHNGYAHLGVIHHRTLEYRPGIGWLISDVLEPSRNSRSGSRAIRLNWLLPDWPWLFTPSGFEIESPSGKIHLEINGAAAPDQSVLPLQFSLFRCGEVIFGNAAPDPILGWISPTYGERAPAISLVAQATAVLPVSLSSLWRLPIL